MAPAASATPATTDLRELIAAEVPELIAIRRDLHAHPELGYEEQRTSQVVQRELKKAGVDYIAGLGGGTGVLAHIPPATPSKLANPNSRIDAAVGLRADMDALPIEEQTGKPYASTTPGKMHACGHDGHTTILIGAARVLSKLGRQSPLPRPVTLVFQPAEEGGAGAARMIADGCLDGSRLGPPVANMFGLHGWPHLPLGVVATKPGPMLAASDRFEITIRGVGAHAAFPQGSRDPIVAGAAVVAALQTIASRNLDPLDSIVVSVTQFISGTAFNVIPDRAEIKGTVRSLTPQVQALAQKRLKEIAEGTAQALGCRSEFTYHINYPVMANDERAVDIFNNVASQALGPERVKLVPRPVMGGEDFAFYCLKVPSCFFILGLVPPGRDSMPTLHQPDFDFNDDAIATGVELFCRLALRE